MKKIISYLIATIMLFGMIPSTAFASEVSSEINTGTYEWINPQYENRVEPSSNENEDYDISAFSDEVVYHTSYESAGEAIRGYLENHIETFSVKYQLAATETEDSNWAGKLAKGIFDAAVKHTGKSTEGDAIACSLLNYKASFSYSDNGAYYYMTITYTVSYMYNSDQEIELQDAISALKDELNIDDKTDYEKVKAIYDYICDNVTYDHEGLAANTDPTIYTAYAALINKKSVCEGYAVLFYRLALEYGIDARVITGSSSGEAHAWNVVKLGDKYYNLDATWDAARTEYSYFLKGSDNFTNHTRLSEFTTDEFNAAYPMSTTDYVPDTNTDTDDTQEGSGSEDVETPTEPAECTHEETEVMPAIASTCTETGLTEGLRCASCGEVLTAQEEVAAGHTPGEEATCTAAQVCTVCEAELVAATGHSYDDGLVTTEPTTTTEGVKTYTCTVCGDTKTESIPMIESETPEDSNTAGDATPETAVISFVGNGLVKEGYFTIKGLNNTDSIIRADYTFSWMNSRGTTGTSVVSGDTMKNFLKDVLGITDEAATIKFTSSDGFEKEFCLDEMFIKDKDGQRPVLAWKVDGEKCNPMLVIGQNDETDINKSKWIKEISKVEVSEGESHLYSDWIIDTDVTCENAGSKHKECACGSVVTEEIPATGHTPGEAATCTIAQTCTTCEAELVAALGHDHKAVVTNPSCTEDGYTTYTCVNCDDSYIADKVAAKGHKFTNYIDDSNATCSKEGTATAKCDNGCGKTDVKVTAKLAHTEVDIPAVAAGCETTGLTAGTKCSVCDVILTAQKEVAATGHAYGDWIVDAEATCTADGFKHKECVCGDKVTETINALGHSAGAAATCTTAQLCTVCGTELAAATGHKFTNYVDDKNATCTKEGTATAKCDNGCGKTDVKATAKLAHTEVVMPAVAAGCETTGLTAGTKCSTCDEILIAQEGVAALGHSAETTIVKATTKKAGSVTESCRTCGEQLSKTTIARINKTTIPYASYVYNSKQRKPVVTVKDADGNKLVKGTDYTVTYKNAKGTKVVTPKAVGKYQVVVKFKGSYSGTVTKTFKINPKGTTIKKLTKPAKKQIKVTWKKQTVQTTGYQIRYSTKQNMNNSKIVTVAKKGATTKTIKQLKAKKKYWIQIRTYKTVNGVKYFSGWSAKKVITTK